MSVIGNILMKIKKMKPVSLIMKVTYNGFNKIPRIEGDVF
jgi:hypothetical protein